MRVFAKRWFFFAAVAAGFFFSSTAPARPLPADITKEQVKERVRRFPATLDPKRSTWRAREIRPAAPMPPDDDTAVTLKTYDYRRSETVVPKTEKIRDLVVRDGVLTFTATKNARLWWGMANASTDTPIQYDAVAPAFRAPLHLLLVVNQDVPESEWEVSLRRANRVDMTAVHPLKLSGEGTWLRAIVPLGSDDSRVLGVALAPKTPGARLKVRELSLRALTAPQRFETVVTLADEPEAATLCVLKSPYYRVSINGERVAEEKTTGRARGRYQTFSGLEKYFRRGENLLQVDADARAEFRESPGLSLEGMVREKNGRVVPIATRADAWRAAYVSSDGRTPTALTKPIEGPPPKGRGYDGGGFFLDPPYFGPIEVRNPNGKDLVYDADKPLTFDVVVYANNFSAPCRLDWKLTDAENDALIASGMSAEKIAPLAAFSGVVRAAVAKPGAYELELIVREGDKVLATRVAEIAAVGGISQREVTGKDYFEGMDLELVDDIDCVDPKSPYRFYHGDAKEYPIRTTPIGTYRETSSTIYDWFGWVIGVDDPAATYVVEAEVPDDADRAFSIRAIGMSGAARSVCNDASGYRGWNPAATGVYTGFNCRLSGKMKPFRFVLYPKVSVIGLMAMSQLPNAPAAVSRLRVFRVKNGLPALKIGSPSRRLTGVHTETLTLVPMTFYSGDADFKFTEDLRCAAYRGFYKHWMNTLDNMVRHTRFTGENMVVAGVYMYDAYNRDTWFTKESANVLDLMGRVFAANDARVIIGLEYSRGGDIQRPTDAEVAAGAPTRDTVSKDGKQSRQWHAENVYVPEVRETLLSRVRELAELYKNTPGIAGVGFQEGVICVPPLPVRFNADPLDYGYDDATIRAFERDTGVTLPVAQQGAERFRQRYEWLMRERRDEWLDWRNGSILALNREIADILHRANPEWTVYVFPIYDYPGDAAADSAARDLARAAGLDPEIYRDQRDLLFGGRYANVIRSVTKEKIFLWSERFNRSPENFRAMDNGTAYLYNGFFENLLTFQDNPWPFDKAMACDIVAPFDWNFNMPLARIMGQATPLVMAQIWLDGQMFTGHEQARRQFNRAFRVIPLGTYETLRGPGFSENLIVRQNRDDGPRACFYVVNPNNWPIEAKLAFGPRENAKVVDLALGETVPAANGETTFAMVPYELKTFALEGGGPWWVERLGLDERASIKSAEARLPESAVAEAKAFFAHKRALYAFVAGLPEERLARLTAGSPVSGGDARVKAVEAAEILRSIDSGEYLTAARLTDSYAAKTWERFLSKQVSAPR